MRRWPPPPGAAASAPRYYLYEHPYALAAAAGALGPASVARAAEPDSQLPPTTHDKADQSERRASPALAYRTTTMGVKVVGKSLVVVDTGKMKILEMAGNAATSDDRISIAQVTVAEPTSEPFLTLHYDEWICVTKGRMVFDLGDGTTVEAKAGETVVVEKGTRFQPTFPEAGTEYVPVCLPAFAPDRCIREEEGVSDVSKRLQELHAKTAAPPPAPPAEVLYHMCEKKLWEAAKAAGGAYFPPTFEQDGFTHATAVPSRLITTANHFYQDSVGDWVCLTFKRSNLLKQCGIMVRDEEAMPVGDKATGADWGAWICPHILGGIPVSVVDFEFAMIRDGKKYLSIEGVC